jgi:hypothetical protein
MATTTPNYGWAVPTSTDLVKDGATAIETLGDAIDASMNTALGTKKAGMVLLSTTSFTGVASAAIANNTFNATYENYKIVLDIENPTADAAIYMKLRASGTDNSTNYFFGFTGNTSAGVNSPDNASGGTSGFLINAVDSGSTNHFYSSDIFIGSPFLTKRTTLMANYVGLTAAGVCLARNGGGWHDVGSSYDAVNFIASSGNITGSIKTYGINQ